MKTTLQFFLCKVAIPAFLAAGIFVATASAAPTGTPPDAPSTHAAHVASGAMPPDAPTSGNSALSQQISDLQVKVSQLEAMLAKSSPAMG